MIALKRLRKSFVMNSVVQFLKRLAQILFFVVVVFFLGSLLIAQIDPKNRSWSA